MELYPIDSKSTLLFGNLLTVSEENRSCKFLVTTSFGRLSFTLLLCANIATWSNKYANGETGILANLVFRYNTVTALNMDNLRLYQKSSFCNFI